MHVQGDFENQNDQKAKAFASQTKEIADGMNMDITNIRENFQEQLREMRSLQELMKRYQSCHNFEKLFRNWTKKIAVYV
jgi:ATP-dependent phosphoenolpyruvate carboxykinase